MNNWFVEAKTVVTKGEISVTAGNTGDGYWDWPKDADGNPDTSQPPVWVPGQKQEMMNPAEAQKYLAEEKQKAMSDPDPNARQERLAALEKNYGAQSNQERDRSVDVIVNWIGKEVGYRAGDQAPDGVKV